LGKIKLDYIANLINRIIMTDAMNKAMITLLYYCDMIINIYMDIT